MTHNEYLRAQRARLQRQMADLAASTVSRPLSQETYLVNVGRYHTMKSELELLDQIVEEPEDDLESAPGDGDEPKTVAKEMSALDKRRKNRKARSWGG